MEEVRANNVCREYKCTTEEPVFKFDRDPYDVVTNSPIIQPVTYCMNHYNERIIAALNSIRWKAERVHQDSMFLNGLANRINKTAHDKGWYDNGTRNFAEVIALMHSELSEALEDWRDPTSKPFKMIMGKPEGWAVELIDCMIRILDTLAEQQISIDYLMKLKMDYNENRPYRHGGKKA